MFTVIILANHDAKAITRTMNALIRATVDGIVREVVLLAESQNDVAAKIADFSGCKLAALKDFAQILLEAKTDWLLVFEAGSFPEEGWAEAVSNFAGDGNGSGYFTRSPLAPRPLFHHLFLAEKPLALGLIVGKSHAGQLLNRLFMTPYDLAKAAKPKPMSAKLRPA